MTQNLLWAILANVITSVLYIALGLMLLFSLYVADKRSLIAFFRLRSARPVLTVYTSRFTITKDTTKSLEPVNRGYEGPGMLRMEYLGAQRVVELFRGSMLTRIPQTVRVWLFARTPTLTVVQTRVDVCPAEKSQLPHGTIVVIGGGVYNLAARVYLDDHSHAFFRFDRLANGERVVRVRRGVGAGAFHGGRGLANQERELAIVQRLTDAANNRVVFVCVGQGTSATYGAARFLAENWRELHRKANGDFGIVLAFPNQPPDVEQPEQVVEPLVIDRCYDPA